MPQDNIERIWNLVSAISQEARNSAMKKCKEKEFDVEKGIVSLEESFSNLSHVRDVLKDAIENKTLIQVPLSFQIDLEKKLTSVVKFLTDLSEGTDTIDPLVQSIDQLYYMIWNSGLENLSGQVLGYHEKINRIKTLEIDLEKLKEKLEQGLEIKDKLDDIKSSFERNGIAISKEFESIKSNSNKVDEDSKAISEKLLDLNETTSGVSIALKNIEASLQKSKADELTIGTLKIAIEEFYKKTEENRKLIEGARSDAEKTIQKSSADTQVLMEKISKEIVELETSLTQEVRALEDGFSEKSKDIFDKIEEKNQKLISELIKREGEIKTQMEKVTGLSLFDSFSRRMDDIIKAKTFWIWGVFISLGCIIALTGYIVYGFKSDSSIDVAFLLKLSMFLPILAAILFCSKNYSHERQLEEEYAFKSSVSLSLVPYKELVEKSPGDPEKYREFLVRSIENIFSSPTDKVFLSEKDGFSKVDKNMKRVSGYLKMFTELAKDLKPSVHVGVSKQQESENE